MKRSNKLKAVILALNELGLKNVRWSDFICQAYATLYNILRNIMYYETRT